MATVSEQSFRERVHVRPFASWYTTDRDRIRIFSFHLFLFRYSRRRDLQLWAVVLPSIASGRLNEDTTWWCVNRFPSAAESRNSLVGLYGPAEAGPFQDKRTN